MVISCPSTTQAKQQQGITVQWVNSQASIPKVLWDACMPKNLEGRWWYETLEESGLQKQFKFFYAIIFDGKPIGIAPCFLMDVPIDLVAPEEVARIFNFFGKFLPSLKYQRTFSVGSPCSDEGSIGLLPGYELSDVVSVLQNEIELKARSLKAPMIAWKDFPDQARIPLLSLCHSHGLFEMASFPGTVLALTPGGNMDTYYNSLKASRRQKIKKKLRSSKTNSDLELQIIQFPSKAILAEVFELFWQTYQKGKTKFEELNETFFDAISTKKQSWFILLRDRHSKKLVAFMLCFELNGRMINKFIGIDYSRPVEWHLYFRLWEEVLSFTILKNLQELQSGQTSYAAKIEMGHDLVPLTNYCKHVNPLVNKIYAYVARGISWATLDHDLATFLKAYPSALNRS